ncbi:MAG: ATPase, T2SS/T4P/T4SS family [Oribacterium sp.]|nr:ATPase, T2SS/T4P/T4SS family [Oribacterium sp.]
MDYSEEDPYSITSLRDKVNLTFSNTIKRSLQDLNLSRVELERQEIAKDALKTAIREASLGDMRAKRMLKSNIQSVICDPRAFNPITEETIDNAIPFHNPGKMGAREKFETLLYIYNNLIIGKDGNTYGTDGIKYLFKDYDLMQPIPNTNKYIVTNEQLNTVYDEVMNDENIPKLTFNDKLEILAQRILDDITFGPVTMLLESSVDEVEGGVSGIPEGSYEFKNGLPENAQYSYDAIWIIMSGFTIHLEFLGFGSQDELIRVCNNIYKYDAPHVMSRTMGQVVATMKDGSRIVVVRPPFADSYAFLARKFDSAPSVAPQDLLRDKGAMITILMLKWLIKSSRNIAITGDQGTGKTTMLKSLIRFIREDYSIRIQELTPELNLRYTYPDRNIMSFRETNTITSQMGLDLQKKTSGSVNIIGEVANAEAASWIIQTAKVASKMTMFTHHAKTTDDLIVSLRNNMMQVNNYTDNAAVDEMIATALNIDVHLERKKGKRFIGRITEIIPIRDRSYPVEDISENEPMEDLERKSIINEQEYHKRMTDRILFTHKDLVKFNEEKQRYEFFDLPTDETLEEMFEALNIEEDSEMIEDFKKIIELAKEEQKEDKDNDVPIIQIPENVEKRLSDAKSKAEAAAQ